MVTAIDETERRRDGETEAIDAGGVPVPSDRYSALKIDLHGGRLCLDFTNTAVWRMRPQPDDTLIDYASLVGWCRRIEGVTAAEADVLLRAAGAHAAEAADVLARAVAVREALYRIFLAEIAGCNAPQSDLALFNHELGGAMASATLRPSDAGFAWGWQELDPTDAPLTRPLWPILHSAAEVLTSSYLARVKRCPGKDCGWLFLDTSKNGSRRWCDMAVCGNRARVRAFAERKRGVRSQESGVRGATS